MAEVIVSESNSSNRWRIILKWVIAALIAAAIMGLLVWFFSGSRGFSKVVAETPEAAAQQRVVQINPQHAHSFTHLMTKEYYEFAVVVYGLPSNIYDALYVQVVQRDGMDWYIDDTSGWGGATPATEVELMDYIKWVRSRGSDTVVVYGISMSDDVAAVELFYEDGHMIRTAVEDGLFLLVSPGQWGHAGVRALDADGEVLGEHKPFWLP